MSDRDDTPRTIGHVDHGKTTLTAAMTFTPPHVSRWPEMETMRVQDIAVVLRVALARLNEFNAAPRTESHNGLERITLEATVGQLYALYKSKGGA